VAVILGVLALGGGACRSRDAGGEISGSAPAFFSGKTMTYVVATEPGGGYDTYGRLIARYIGRYLGLSRVVVKNVPGAHQRGLHEIATARADGLTIGTFNTGAIYTQLLKSDGVDLQELSWIGKAGGDARVLVVSSASGWRSIEDLKNAGRPILVATSGVGSQGYNDAMLIAHVLGVKTRMVHGLSSNDSQLSMLRGEVEAEFASLSSYRVFLQNGNGRALARVGDATGDEAAIPDLAAHATTVEAQEILDVVRTQGALLRWTAGPAGIPPERLAALRDAYMAALNDPGLIAEAAKLRIPLVPMDGATLAREVTRILSQPPAVVRRMAALLSAAPVAEP
jgi:tripartite-type tricarboxylate transporter receptor subunit TctC